MRPARLLPLCFSALLLQAQDPGTLLPVLRGWFTLAEATRYLPEDLYEFIDGAADGFLECDFRELVFQSYHGLGGSNLAVEIYRHADPDAAFGIYSQERSAASRVLRIGAEGYHEPGILNFVKGPFYVKLNGYKLGRRDPAILERAARLIAARIPGPARLPALLKAFPEEGRVAGSTRYLRRNALGYLFLASAFTADYRREGQAASLWIFAPEGAGEARAMLAAYLGAQGRPDGPPPEGPVSLVDLHHGPVSLDLVGNRLLGVVGGDAATRAALLEGLRKGLALAEPPPRPALSGR